MSSACALTALKRGLNSELAAACGVLHDIYSYRTGIFTYHEHNGAEMACPVLRDMGVFTVDEQKIILSAIFHHGDKSHIHDEYDEVLKDADILQPFLNNAGLKIFKLAVPRLTHLSQEFNMQINPVSYGSPSKSSQKISDRATRLADIAEQLARKKFKAELSDKNFTEVIKYWPDDNAFNELKTGWCAAFVYHCCIQAGFMLPIGHHLTSCRFAGVGAWYQWANLLNYCRYDKDGFTPCKGDIVIYNNIIPIENKEPNAYWHDHIGIVISCTEDKLMDAEGNIDNQNISGIVERRRNEKIGCFIRIPEDYEYDGWKYDYKTHNIRMESYPANSDFVQTS